MGKGGTNQFFLEGGYIIVIVRWINFVLSCDKVVCVLFWIQSTFIQILALVVFDAL